MPNPLFIAEVKPKSPYGFYSRLAWMELWALATTWGDWISIHTDWRWGGSYKFLAWAADNTDKPVLAKGFHQSNQSIEAALECGAQWVLTVDYMPDSELVEHCLLEVSSLTTLERFLHVAPNARYVYNGRDLLTGLEKPQSDYQQYREKCQWLCGASFLGQPKDVLAMYPQCDAYLVGEHLDKFCQTVRQNQGGVI